MDLLNFMGVWFTFNRPEEGYDLFFGGVARILKIEQFNHKQSSLSVKCIT